MTVALVDSTKFPQRSTGNGVTTVFPFQWKALSSGDIKVYVAGILQTEGVNYTVSGLGVDAGGNVTFISGAPANGASVIIIRSMQRSRTTDYQQQGDFLSTTVNPDFDNAVLLIQDLAEQVSRCLQGSITDPLTTTSLAKTTFAGQFIAVDASGNVVPSFGTGADTGLRTDLANTTTAGRGNELVSIRATASELASLVTIVNPYYPPGHVYRYGTNTIPGTTDMAAAINAAVASWNGSGGIVQFPRDTVIVNSALVVTAPGIKFQGYGFSEASGSGSANRGPSCILRGFGGTNVTLLTFNADCCGIDGIDLDGNFQGTKCLGMEIWGSRFTLGQISSRNHSGRGGRAGRDDSPTGGNNVARSNVNFLSIRKLITTGNIKGGWLFDDQNLSTTLSYPLGSANVNACNVDLIDSRNNGTQHNITAITKAAAAVVTVNTVSAIHPVEVGDTVSFAAVLGMTQINSATTLQAINVTAVGGVSGAWTITTNLDTTGYGAYTSNGVLGVGCGVEVWNANDIKFGIMGCQGNFGAGLRFKTDGVNAVSRCHHVLLNDCEANIGPDIQIDGGTLPASGPGQYNIILGNRSVAINSRIVDNSSGSLVIQWNAGLLTRAYHFGPEVQAFNQSGNAGFTAYVGANASPARVYAIASGAVDSKLRGSVHKNGGTVTDGWEINQNAVFTPFNDLFLLTYSASINIDASLGHIFQLTVTNTSAFTINAPTNPYVGQRIHILIRNNSGGAMGVITWPGNFKMTAWTNPANSNQRMLNMFYDGTNWIMYTATSNDVPL